VIVDAWMRVRERPRWRANCSVLFEDFFDGAAAVRSLAQSGLQPANCRLLDAAEAEINGVSAEGSSVLVIGFESARVPVAERLDQAVEIVRDHGGSPGVPELRDSEDEGSSRSNDAGSDWRNAFLAAPYLRDALICSGVMTETFETAITWDRFDEFTRSVLEEARRVTAEISDTPMEGPGSPSVSCRITHAYSDGAAPYFTVLAPSRPGAEVAQWDEIKRAVSEVLDSAGATITHHHAVGRDHRPWYDRQRPQPFADALIAAKRALDPHGLMNPGVLIDPGGH
jgi:alkyldihydroxyacetonephosphate synthase